MIPWPSGRKLGHATAGHVRQLMVDKRIEARAYTREQGEDAPEVANWTWPS
jgi:xylulose-5-phosphate/fructose-6-phosphate phosphoketolase